jgi:hypothetical protein
MKLLGNTSADNIKLLGKFLTNIKAPCRYHASRKGCAHGNLLGKAREDIKLLGKPRGDLKLLAKCGHISSSLGKRREDLKRLAKCEHISRRGKAPQRSESPGKV